MNKRIIYWYTQIFIYNSFMANTLTYSFPDSWYTFSVELFSLSYLFFLIVCNADICWIWNQTCQVDLEINSHYISQANVVLHKVGVIYFKSCKPAAELRSSQTSLQKIKSPIQNLPYGYGSDNNLWMVVCFRRLCPISVYHNAGWRRISKTNQINISKNKRGLL